MIVPAETLVFFMHGCCVLYNVFTRTCLALEAEGLTVVQALARGEETPQGSYQAWNIGWFSSEAGLLEDPTRILRDRTSWPEPELLNGADLVCKLLKLSLVVQNREEYLARFSPKKSLFDFHNFGNFHQQLGQHLMAVKRMDPGKWWYNQKFLPELSGIRDNLYKSIQEERLKALFASELTPGMYVVDMGCGVGYFTRMMAAQGAKVIGLDPNAHYVELSKKDATGSLRFVRTEIGAEPLDMIEDGWADMVFMSDALLFYFIPEAPRQKANPAMLLADIHRILKPGGRFLSLEPHSAFFLAPRLGDEDRPFTVLTEYRNKQFGITPPLSETLGTVLQHGFALTHMEELYPADLGQDFDQRGYHFSSEFPQWQLLEFRKVD